MMRPRTAGPRSLMRTTTDLSLARFVTRTIVPKGSVACAAVAGGTAYFASADGFLYAVDARTGRELWRKSFPSDWTGDIYTWGPEATPAATKR